MRCNGGVEGMRSILAMSNMLGGSKPGCLSTKSGAIT